MLVTGGASGIGQRVAHGFAKEGAVVAVADRDLKGAERVAEAVRRYAHRYRQPGDRDDRVAIEIAVERIIGRVE